MMTPEGRKAYPEINTPNSHIPVKRKAHSGLRTKAVSVGLTVGLVGVPVGLLTKHAMNEKAANEAEPFCDVPVTRFETTNHGTVSNIKEDITGHGDNVRDEDSITWTRSKDNQSPTIRTSETTGDYSVGGSQGITAGDVVRVDNVSPGVCLAVGGVIMGDEARMAIPTAMLPK